MKRIKVIRRYSLALLGSVLVMLAGGCGRETIPDTAEPVQGGVPVGVDDVPVASAAYRLPPEVSLAVVEAGLRVGLTLFFDMETSLRLAETIVRHLPPEVPPPGVVDIILSFDDGPHTQVTGTGRNYTENVLETLRRNSLRNNIKAVFFVQTHCANRGGNGIGRELIGRMAQSGHIVGVHTGSTKDHVSHVVRCSKAAYDINHDGKINRLDGSNALESDMIRAQVRIKQYTGQSPVFVRPTYGAFNNRVRMTYEMRNLNMIMWDVASEDNIRRGEPIENIERHLRQSVRREIQSGNRRILVLFHDINRRTQQNLMRYLYCITDTVMGMGLRPRFPTSRWELHRMLMYKAR